MSENSSSNGSLLQPHHYLPLDMYCYIIRPNSFILTSFITTNIVLLLPLCIFIIYHGLQHWWKKRSTSSAAPMSHSDSFTYHLVAMEMIGVLGGILTCCGIHKTDSNMILVGGLLTSFTWFGEMFFHVLTCLERYLAVIHPVTYLSLRRERGVRIRNITIGCVWLLCSVGPSLMTIETVIVILDFCFLILSFVVFFFCSLSVLCVLIPPGPGEQGGGRERVDQSKQRAFYTIAAILGVLVLRFTGSLIWAVLYVTGNCDCVINTCLIWFNVPSSLVLPLLFVHREGKLVCCKG